MPSRAVLKEDDTIPHMPAGAFVMEEEVPLMPPGAFVKEEVVVKREHEVVADEGGRSEGRPKRQQGTREDLSAATTARSLLHCAFGRVS